MKITIIGGGGVRTPLAIPPILRRAERLGLEELCLMDIDGEKLRLIGSLAQEAARLLGGRIRITRTTDVRQALRGTSFVITTLRVGNDHGRVLDERLALRHGVLGQETTGAGGFAMAMRSIPAILEVAETLDQLSPGAWMLNFTNPAGLVTQALRDRGFSRVIGICDGANRAREEVARWLHLDPRELTAEVFGLNHLSWARSVRRNGQELLGPLLRDPDFLAGTSLRLFDPALIERMGLWLNEYLLYWYCSKEALAVVSRGPQTRGEAIQEWNQTLMADLRRVELERDPETAIGIYRAYMERRAGTYGAFRNGAPREAAIDTASEAGEGYMGVALDTMDSLTTGESRDMALNVSNEGAIDGMEPADVVEVSCTVNGRGAHPHRIGAIPEPQALLMRTVKLYERLAVEAILQRSRALAAEALMVHPLVYSYPLGKTLVDEYLEAHKAYVGEWS